MLHSFSDLLEYPGENKNPGHICMLCVCALTATEYSCGFVLGLGRAGRAMVACYTVLDVHKK